MLLEDYGQWLTIRENGTKTGQLCALSLFEAVCLIRDKFPKGPVHWVDFHKNINNKKVWRMRLGFRFFKESPNLNIILNKGAIRDIFGKPIPFECEEGIIHEAMRANMVSGAFKGISNFFEMN